MVGLCAYSCIQTLGHFCCCFVVNLCWECNNSSFFSLTSDHILDQNNLNFAEWKLTNWARKWHWAKSVSWLVWCPAGLQTLHGVFGLQTLHGVFVDAVECPWTKMFSADLILHVYGLPGQHTMFWASVCFRELRLFCQGNLWCLADALVWMAHCFLWISLDFALIDIYIIYIAWCSWVQGL